MPQLRFWGEWLSERDHFKMKKLKRAICLILALTIFALPLAGCNTEQDVFEITVDGGTGEKTYSVPYELYQTIFVYLKGIVTNIVEDSEGNKTLATTEEKNKAIKEVAENTIIEFYGLVALAADYGISITEEDRQAFQAEYREKLQAYVNDIDDAEFDFNGTKEEYAEVIYRNAMRIAGTTPEYYEFSHYRALLTQRLKAVIGGDLSDYLNQSYCHYKQVIVLYSKGDAAAEENARLAITEAREKLLSGADIDDVIAEYGDKDYQSEIYFDAYGNIVGSSAGDAVNAIVINAIKALDENEISDIMSGDESDRLAYFAIYQRLGFDSDFICSDNIIAEDIYAYSYVGSSYYTPHYSRYQLLLESYTQNTALMPYDVKAYNRININNID